MFWIQFESNFTYELDKAKPKLLHYDWMKNTYFDLIDQSYYFPQEGFDLRAGSLTFHGISLQHLITKYGTPFRFIYLPKIGDQIKKARNLSKLLKLLQEIQEFFENKLSRWYYHYET